MNPAYGVPLVPAAMWQNGTSRYSWPFCYLTAKRDMQLERLQCNAAAIYAFVRDRTNRSSGDWIQANTRMEIFMVVQGWACIVPPRQTLDETPRQGLRMKISDLDRHFRDFGLTS